MARVTLGGVISSISGSVGSACFRNSPSGTVLYNRPLPSQRSSTDQHTNRSILKAAAAAWSLLADDIRTAWGSLAKQEHIPTFFSRGRRWTGRQLFTCFYFYAELQLTPLPPRWLPTPPLFFMHNLYQIFWGSPWYHVPNPFDPGPYPEGWYSIYSYVHWRPLVLNPTPPYYGPEDTPTSFFFGYSPINSNTPPRSMNRLWFPRWLPFPPPYNEFYIQATAGLSAFGPVLFNTYGAPPGMSPSVNTRVPRTFDLWYSLFALGDDRLYYSGLRSCPCQYSPSDPSPDMPYVIYNQQGPGPNIGSLTPASNFPKSEV